MHYQNPKFGTKGLGGLEVSQARPTVSMTRFLYGRVLPSHRFDPTKPSVTNSQKYIIWSLTCETFSHPIWNSQNIVEIHVYKAIKCQFRINVGLPLGQTTDASTRSLSNK